MSQSTSHACCFACFALLDECPCIRHFFAIFYWLLFCGFSDSDWATCLLSRKSITGFYLTLGGCPVSWKCRKQPTVSLSSAEAEYRAVRKVVAEVVWLIHLLDDLGLVISSPVPIYCDSQAALRITKNPVFHERTKHIKIDCYFVLECLNNGLISLSFCSLRWTAGWHLD